VEEAVNKWTITKNGQNDRVYSNRGNSLGRSKQEKEPIGDRKQLSIEKRKQQKKGKRYIIDKDLPSHCVKNGGFQKMEGRKPVHGGTGLVPYGLVKGDWPKVGESAKKRRNLVSKNLLDLTIHLLAINAPTETFPW